MSSSGRRSADIASLRAHRATTADDNNSGQHHVAAPSRRRSRHHERTGGVVSNPCNRLGRRPFGPVQHYRCHSSYEYTAVSPVISPAGRSCGRAHLCHQARGALMVELASAGPEDLDVMERSPDLPLHFADENREPSASCGLNALAEQVAGAMKRSISTNPGSENTKTGCKSGAQLIETAPRDGGFLILEEEARAKKDIARWASEAGGWVRENGEPIKIRPSRWYPIEGENYLQHGLDISISPPPRERAAPQQQFASAVITSRSDAAPPETVATAKIDATAVEPKRASRARNRFAAFAIAASLVVAICVGMYFRAEQDLRQTLLQERDRVAELTRELATARHGLEKEVAQSNKATEEADRLRQAANAATAELEQERSRSAALARDLESAQRLIAARSATERPASNQPDPMKQGSPTEPRRSRR